MPCDAGRSVLEPLPPATRAVDRFQKSNTPLRKRHASIVRFDPQFEAGLHEAESSAGLAAHPSVCALPQRPLCLAMQFSLRDIVGWASSSGAC